MSITRNAPDERKATLSDAAVALRKIADDLDAAAAVDAATDFGRSPYMVGTVGICMRADMAGRWMYEVQKIDRRGCARLVSQHRQLGAAIEAMRQAERDEQSSRGGIQESGDAT